MADAEAKADTLPVAARFVVQLPEVLKQLILVLLGDAAALVSDRDFKADQHLFDDVFFAVSAIDQLLVGGGVCHGFKRFDKDDLEVDGNFSFERRELNSV